MSDKTLLKIQLVILIVVLAIGLGSIQKELHTIATQCMEERK